MSPAGSFPENTIRSVSGIVSSCVALAIALFLIGDAIIKGSWSIALPFIPWLLLLVWITYVGTAASMARIGSNELVFRNMLRVHTVPWQHITDISVKYQVLISTDDSKQTPLMAGPAAGRPARLGKSDGAQRRIPPILTFRDELYDTWQERKDSATGAISHTWDWPIVVIGGALLVWAILSTVL